MKAPELLKLLQEFYRDRLIMYRRHVAGARHVGDYDFNNTYQYVINREETHVAWLQTALAEFGAPLPPPSSTIEVPPVQKRGKKVEASAFRGILEDDARHLGTFVERWRPRVGAD